MLIFPKNNYSSLLCHSVIFSIYFLIMTHLHLLIEPIPTKEDDL